MLASLHGMSGQLRTGPDMRLDRWHDMAMLSYHTFQPFVAVVLVDEDIIYLPKSTLLEVGRFS